MAMFGFGKGKNEDGKVKKDEKDIKPVKRVFGVPLETLSLVDAKCFDSEVLSVPIVVRDTIEWLRQNKGSFSHPFHLFLFTYVLLRQALRRRVSSVCLAIRRTSMH